MRVSGRSVFLLEEIAAKKAAKAKKDLTSGKFGSRIK